MRRIAWRRRRRGPGTGAAVTSIRRRTRRRWSPPRPSVPAPAMTTRCACCTCCTPTTSSASCWRSFATSTTPRTSPARSSHACRGRSATTSPAPPPSRPGCCESPETLRSITFERSVRCPSPRSTPPARRRSCRPASAWTRCKRPWPRCPEDQRQVMLLRLVAGLTPGEVAERLGRSVDAVARPPAPRPPAPARGAHAVRLGPSDVTRGVSAPQNSLIPRVIGPVTRALYGKKWTSRLSARRVVMIAPAGACTCAGPPGRGGRPGPSPSSRPSAVPARGS